MRVLGVDLGKARIGIAVMDWDSGIATARTPLKAIGTLTKDAEQVMAVYRAEEVDKVVLGLALIEGAETRMSMVARRFGGILEGLGATVDFADESLTSWEAGERLASAGVKGSDRKGRLDGESACQILERYRGQG